MDVSIALETRHKLQSIVETFWPLPRMLARVRPRAEALLPIMPMLGTWRSEFSVFAVFSVFNVSHKTRERL